MYVIIWQFQVKADQIKEFESIYAASGLWVELFTKSAGFLSTELLVNEKHPYQYITIDRWTSAQDYETFLAQWNAEYAALDAQCEALTEQETLLGKWESILSET